MSTSLSRRARWRRAAATLVPVVVPMAMRPVFHASVRRFGPERGYQAGFAAYWATCWALAATLVGPRAMRDLFRPNGRALPEPRPASAAVLLAAPVGAATTELLPHLRDAGPGTLAFAAGLGTTNALAEEVLWRGVPIATFPDDPVRGWLWPALGFAAWHLVPMSTRPTTARRRAALLAGSAVVGLANGWIAHRTGTLAAVTTAHAVTDSCGVRAVRTIWLPRAAERS